MYKFLTIDSPVYRFMCRLKDFLVLNLLYLFSCIPVVTIGAANAALYRVAADMRRGECKVFRDYWRSFRQNFKQATILFIITILLTAVLCADVYLLRLIQSQNRLYFMLPFFILLLLLGQGCVFLYPLIARYSNSLRRTGINALVLGIRYFYLSIPLLLIQLFPLAAFFFQTTLFFQIGYVWLFLYFSLTAYLEAWILDRVFRRIQAVKEAEEEHTPHG